ncbi:TRAP transporter large permease [Marinibaculum pumilum]|uniref:TRAP transporter large permease protein n=1 Tax=Marinibaculum pumilum TaxID=1766165 RepID=A0ABV7L861_9PROT
MVTALIAFAVMLALIFLRVPIAFAMGLVGFFGFAFLLDNYGAALAMVRAVTYETGSEYNLSIVPMFILMGNLVSRSGMSQELYRAAYSFLGHRSGGLAMSTVVACGGFSAICGSSLATAATMSKVAMPEMKKYGYDPSLAAGSIAAGGTLGILIPPSVILVIYGILTEQDIASLFAAGILPGILGVLLYMAAVRFTTWRNPAAGPPGEKTPWGERARALLGVWGVLVLFLVVLGAIYTGYATPTESAAVGAFGALVLALLRRSLTWRSFLDVLYESAATTAMLFVILIGALIFANFINMTGMAQELTSFALSLEMAPIFVIFFLVVVYLVLGCVLESLSMILLTVPVFYPLVDGLGYDLVWFGIMVVVVTEISLITPPVGLNVFVLRSVLPEVGTGTIFRGVTPFWCADIVRLAIIILIPGLSLWLPSLFYG